MKYISYTFIDDATRLPVSQEPARKGPVMPEGVEYVFSIEKSFSSGVPLFFGKACDDFIVEPWMTEYSEEAWLECFKYELKERASLKKKLFISQGCVEGYSAIFTYSKSTLDGLYSVVNAMMLDYEISEVDFETQGTWVRLNLSQAREILVSLNKNIQSIFTWCCDIHRQVHECASIKDALVIQESIAQYIGGV